MPKSTESSGAGSTDECTFKDKSENDSVGAPYGVHLPAWERWLDKQLRICWLTLVVRIALQQYIHQRRCVLQHCSRSLLAVLNARFERQSLHSRLSAPRTLLCNPESQNFEPVDYKAPYEKGNEVLI